MVPVDQKGHSNLTTPSSRGRGFVWKYYNVSLVIGEGVNLMVFRAVTKVFICMKMCVKEMETANFVFKTEISKVVLVIMNNF